MSNGFSNEWTKFRRIMNSISHGRNEEAKSIIETIENRSELVDVVGSDLLYHAIQYNNTEMMEYLIDGGCDVNKLKDGSTLLGLAISSNKVRVVDVLLRNNADIYYIDDEGKSSLEVAFYSRLRPDPWQSTVVFKNQDPIVKMLFDKVNDDFLKGTSTQLLMDASDSFKLAILMYSNADVKTFILENGYPLDFYLPEEHYTALHCAIRLARFESAKMLIEHGAYIDALDRNYCTPLHYYISHFEDADEQSQVLKRFLRHSNHLCDESDGYTLLEGLIKYGKKTTVRTILLSDVDVDERTSRERTVSSLLIENENPDIYDIFTELKDKIDVNKRSWNGFTALMSAALSGCPKKVEFLLRHGADVNLISSIGLSALSYAFNITDYSKVNPIRERNIVKVVEILLQNGADAQFALRARPNLINTLTEKSKVMVSHLAMIEAIEPSSLTDYTRNLIESTSLLNNYFDFCAQELEKMKDMKVYDTVTLFTLLTEKEEKVLEYTRNQKLCTAWTNAMKNWRHCVSYYLNILLKRHSRRLAPSWRT